MKHRLPVIAGWLLLASLLGLAASEKKVHLKDLPPAVQAAVQEETKGATLKGLAEERENGAVFYEAETIVKGHTRDVLFDTAGKIVVVEEEMAIDAVPAPVRTAFQARGTIHKVESVTKGGTVTYEAEVDKNGKRSEVAVGADGQPVKH